MIKHVIVIDKSSIKSIDKQNNHIQSGVPVNQSMVHDVKKIVDPILKSRCIILKKYYGDAFYKRELVRFKFVIEPCKEFEIILKELKLKLLEHFKIKKLTYIEEDESSSMILIWM